ncbi:MAG: TolC family protein [Acidobacteriaceae bacterium]|nr:TolC family protein [Acidobacteriaceae bacterium]
MTHSLSNSHSSRSLMLTIALGTVALASAVAQTPSAATTAATGCTSVINERAVARCLHEARYTPAIPRLDDSHVYELPELIDIAESASPAGRIAWEQAKRSAEQAGIAKAEYLPLLTFVAEGSDARVIVPFPKPIAPIGYVTVEEPAAVAQMELHYSLLDFGRRPRITASQANEIASTLHLSRVHQQIAFNTAIAFYRAQEAAAQLAAAKDILETAKTLSSNAQSQFDQGRSTLPDVQNADAGAAEAAYSLTNAAGEVEKSKLALTETLGIEPTTRIEIAPPSTGNAEAFDKPVEEYLDVAWKSRPDLLAKVQALRAAKAEARNAHSQYLPAVSLKASGGQTSLWPTADYGELGNASVSTWSAAVQLRWDVFNGARQHNVQSANAEARAAAEEKREAQDAVTHQVWDAYVEYHTSLEQERAAESYLKASQTSYDSSLDAFRYGVRSLVDVVEAERQLAQARLASVKAYAHRQQSASALGYAIGSFTSYPSGATGVHP